MSRGPRRPPPAGSDESWVVGVNPVTELIEARPGDVERVLVARGRERTLGRVLRRARVAGVPVSYVDRRVLEQRVGRGGGTHQGLAALAAAFRYRPADEICRDAARDGAAIVLLVDRVVDPGNLGAILRTAAGAGVAGVLLSAEDTVGVTPAAIRASAGVAERLAVGREPSPSKRIEALAEAGWRTAALDPRGETDWSRAELDGRLLVVAGGEERGPRPGVLRACRQRIALPLAPGVESLNVAVATGVLLFEAIRRRAAIGERP